MVYNPALDGLRAIAALAVLFYHCKVPGFGGGFLGVDVFFVLSGYLITRVLSENPDLLRFYWRRALRLVPPLALVLAAYVAAYPLLRPDYPHHGRDALLAFFYLSDYGVAFFNAPNYLRHTWSLAVEEHFYLLWPLVFLRWSPGLRALLVAYLVASVWRYAWPGEWFSWYARFDTRLSGLILGCLIARARPMFAFPAWPGLVVLAGAFCLVVWRDPRVPGLVMTIVELAAAVAVLGTPPRWLTHAALVYVGKLSYGLYLWHYPIARLFRDDGDPWLVSLAVTLPCSLLLAAMSYHSIEALARRAMRADARAHQTPGPS